MGAQNNIDFDVLEIFGKNKIFVEAGGSDPQDQNNTSLLEKNGWKGLIVEPKKDFNFKYSNLRKNSILENYVLVSSDYSDDTIEGDFDHYMMGGVQNIHGLNWNPQKFPCIQLQKLLSKHNMEEIHFLSLDVEGYEKEVLNGVDFIKTFIHLIVVECHIKNGERESFDFLEEKGFKKIKQKTQHDYYFNVSSNFFPETK
jgi:FkbM family methyltransferase